MMIWATVATFFTRCVLLMYNLSLRAEEVYSCYTPSLKSEGSISGKLLMFKNKGRIFVKYTIVAAVVHMT